MVRRLVVGITGCIGAGKTTLAALVAEQGIPVISADAVGHSLLTPASPVVLDLVRAFGPLILDDAGGVDRKELAAAAFATPNGVARLNAITHPPLLAAIKSQLQASPSPITVIDAALIVEWGVRLPVDVVVVVVAAETTRRERTKGRYDRAAFSRRQASQGDADDKRARADVVVINDGDARALKVKAYELVSILNDIANNIFINKEQVVI